MKVLNGKGTHGKHVKAYSESLKSRQNLKVLHGNGIHGRHVKAYSENPKSWQTVEILRSTMKAREVGQMLSHVLGT